MQKYIMRLDDFSEFRNKDKWDKVECILDKYNIHPLVGVIPLCKEQILIEEGNHHDLWEKLKTLDNKGWTIAMHGYTHKYRDDRHKHAEFWNITYEEAKKRVLASLKIFVEHGYNPQVFFAPAHQFNNNTVNALIKNTDIRIISDGYASLPYMRGEMKYVPAQTGTVKIMPYYKLVTFVYHPNTMNEEDFIVLEDFIRENKKSFIDFPTKPKTYKISICDYIYYVMLFMSRIVRGNTYMMKERVIAHYGLINSQGILLYMKGVFRRLYYKGLLRKYGFARWHIIPYELRPYAYFLVNYINKTIMPNSVIEYGCGLGDILRNLDAEYKYGIDVSSEVIRAAKYLDRTNSCVFTTGKLGEDIKGIPEQVDLLITVNFIHNISKEDLIKYYERILKTIKVKNILVDGYGGAYKYHHFDWEVIIPGYKIERIYQVDKCSIFRLKIDGG